MDSIHQARLAQSVEHQTLNRRVVGSSPTMDKKFFILYFVASDALLAGRLVPCKWNQAWRPSELYMCIEREREREKVDFKSREVNCLKECALALSYTTWLRTFLSELYSLRENCVLPVPTDIIIFALRGEHVVKLDNKNKVYYKRYTYRIKSRNMDDTRIEMNSIFSLC